MLTRIILAAFLLALVLSPIPSPANEVRYYEKDGVTYCETRQVVEQRVPETRLEGRTETVYRSEMLTEMRDVVRVYWTPVMQYELETYWVGRWNPFVEPRLVQRYVPRTHWEQKSDVVKIPIRTCRTVPETRMVQTPVTAYRSVQKEILTRTPVSGNALPAGGTKPSDAQYPQVGGLRRLDSDPPRYGVADGWHATTLR